MASWFDQSTSAATLGKFATWMGDQELWLVTWKMSLMDWVLKKVRTPNVDLIFQVTRPHSVKEKGMFGQN